MSHAFATGMKHDAQTPPTELEVKFRLPPDVAARLAAHPALQDCADGGSFHDVTTYYDTPDQMLAQNGISLRVRQRGADYIQTLKLPATAQSHAFARQEWEWPLGSNRPDLQWLHETPLAPCLGELNRLGPVFVTDVHRHVRTLQREGATIELAFDRGEVRAGNRAEPIHELELELKHGDPEQLYRLAAALHADVAMTIGAESKADRGWRLRTGHPRTAVKQANIALPPDASAWQAFGHITARVLAHLLANEPAAETGEMEGVHQMRVAIRRLRSMLVVFGPLLETHAAAQFTAEMRRMGRVFGEARDWDVFCADTLPAAQQQGVAAGWVELLRPVAERERAAAHACVSSELHGQALTALTLGLAEWAADPRSLAGDPSGNPMQAPMHQLAPELIGRLAHKVRRRGGDLEQRHEAELHALRKSLKKLRYAVEFLAPLGKKSRVKTYLHACEAMQRHLGSLNDAVVAVALAERLGGDRKAAFAPALAGLAGWATARQHEARRHMHKAWRKFEKLAPPF